MAGANVWIVRAGRHHDAPLARAKAELRGSGQKTASNQLITAAGPLLPANYRVQRLG